MRYRAGHDTISEGAGTIGGFTEFERAILVVFGVNYLFPLATIRIPGLGERVEPRLG